ncbi:MAG TPA: Rieske 2Fe-2S domain-containing protein [Gemmatimonadales bacterium]|nr:Rieske 2Fe-2S domain-containing protein [Gemmatimonadales bacterium]
MSNRYIAVNWNRQKRLYDTTIALGVLLLVAGFFVATLLSHPHMTAETGLIRGLGLTGFVLLHVILLIGPLCRLDPRFLPLLYNRRHLGVTLCLVALGHAGFVLFQYHALGDVNPLASLLGANLAFGSLAGFPFELLGVAALLILIVMAATSHDFWLSVLSPRVWKALHMLVYLAYALLVGHVALGAMQAESGWVGPLALALGFALVVGLHLAAGLRERQGDRPDAGGEWVPVCRVEEIPERRARLAMVAGERVAVFRSEGRLSAVSNVCKHQNGPLGEGRVVDGCITCPWHGYQYRPEDGTSPPPFDDKVPTYDVRVDAGLVTVRRGAHPPGTRVEPVAVQETGSRGAAEWTPETAPPFYIGYAPAAAPELARHTRKAVALIGAAALATVIALALAQAPFAASRFEYGQPRSVTGRLVAAPYPRLEVAAAGGVTQYLLAAAGKHGAAALAAPLDGRMVRLRGTLAQRGNAAMLEIDSLVPAEAAPAAPLTQQPLGEFALTGEIVDSKCWTGVMNPGEGKTHLECAVRCVSGGLPPLLALRDSLGREAQLVLTDIQGGPLPREVLPLVGRPVRVHGTVVREGSLLFLRTSPGAVEVLR